MDDKKRTTIVFCLCIALGTAVIALGIYITPDTIVTEVQQLDLIVRGLCFGLLGFGMYLLGGIVLVLGKLEEIEEAIKHG